MKHSHFGYSAVSTYENCPRQYKLRYIDGLEAIPSDDPANALYLGTALHTGIERDVETAISEYFGNYPIISDLNVNEEVKLRHLIPKVKTLIPEGLHETRVEAENFIGTLDLLVPVGEDVFDLYDFKYSNNRDRYMESRQLHLYKYYFEKVNPGKSIRDMYFVFVPKTMIRQKKTEDLRQFRQRLNAELEKLAVKVEKVAYDPNKVIQHLETCVSITQDKDFPTNPTKLCDWCEFKKFCQEEDDAEMLPSIEKVPVEAENFRKIWLYGEPFSGKTHLAAEAPEPILELNTDGNIKYYDMPRLAIKDTPDGRQTIPAWEVFKGAVDDLAKGSDFRTIVLDLTEDIYDVCRAFVCESRGWEHESDDSFKAYDIVRSEFLRTIRKLMNLPYNIILISHEDSSKDLTKRGGDKVTRIKPNITDKIAGKLAGMVDVVIRTTKDGNTYTISTKTSDVIFGGGRLHGMKAVDMPNSWASVNSLYGAVADTEEIPEEVTENTATPSSEEAPVRRTRRTRA